MKWATLLFLLISQLSTAQIQNAYLSASLNDAFRSSIVHSFFQEVPFELVNGMILVEAELNYQRGTFILDTGAPTLVLNQRLENTKVADLAQSCSGNFQVHSSIVRHFKWENLMRYEMNALMVDLTHLEVATRRPIRGMIGYQLLKDYEVLIDYENERLILFNAESNPLHQALRPILTASFNFQGHLPVVALQLDGQTLYFGLDTGSGSNLIDPCTLLKLSADLSKPVDEEFLQGLDQQVKKVSVIRIDELEFDQMPLDPAYFLVSELCHLRKTAGVTIDGLLGYNFFQNMKISINYQKKEIYFWDWIGDM